MNYNEAVEKLKTFNQEHVLRFYEELNEDGKKELLSQIERTDFTVIEQAAEGSAEWSDLIITYAVLIPSAVVMMIFARPLNAMMMGDSSAITLGVNVNAVRKLLIFITAVLTSSAVAVSGCIGFVGLIVPHIVRSVTGADHSKVIPLSLLCGSIFMIWADVAARLVCAPAELPVGILTALFGGPLFLWMVRKRRYEFGK